MKPIAQLIDLRGRQALVTGAAGHIGKAVCQTLMELGAQVAVLDLETAACEARCRELNDAGFSGKAFPLPCDLASEAQVRQAVRTAAGERETLHILVHCAAFVGTTNFPGWAVPLETQTVQAWHAAMDINLTSAFIMVQEARPLLELSGHGSVIFLSSIYGRLGPDNRLYEGTAMVTLAGYAASKGGLNQLGRYFATTLAPRIRVNTIVAGGVQRNQPEVFHQRYMDRTPLQRMAVEEDFKGAVAYLAGDLSAYVTGVELPVDGGWHAW